MGKKPEKVKLCRRNWDNGSKQLNKALKKDYPELKRKKKDCLGKCKTCRSQCLIMVGSDYISAASHQAVLKKLKKRMD
ncbi:hypothetical protein A7K91_24515 [Paenibacillus oryzae]|uniref:DUF1450 domain-containing protein n=1 Tax=Paenibacillus oryzae TaxID=1844972 RepID=A0A1A5YL88_9BACL|nr:DUF1450 domain-containing protein [Paenibacillus oryzae]OBR66384.1 hypothetical protein A7K91_24515 [Paenibacillus oryzae]